MRMEQYKPESAIKRALEESGDYWDQAMENPRSNRFADQLLIGLLVFALIATIPYWLPIGLIQVSSTYFRIKMERLRATRSGRKSLHNKRKNT